MKIAVVGAGVAGLTAALRLAQRGHEVHVFERGEKPGGLAAGFPVGPSSLEKFYHHLFLSDHAILDLCREIGVSSRLHWLESRMGFTFQGKLYPFGTPMELLRFQPLPLWERFWFGVIAFYLGKVKNWRKYESITAAEWMRRFAGPKTWEILWRPLLKGKFGPYFDRVAMAWLWARIHVRASSRGGVKERLGYFKGGFDVFHEALARAVQAAGAKVHFRASIEKILTEKETFQAVEIEGQGREHFDRLIFTGGTPLLLKLCPGLPEEYRKKVSSLPFLGAQCLILSLKQPFSSLYWINVADEEIPALALIEHTNFAPPEWYGGRRLMYIGNYLEAGHPFFQKNAQELFEIFYPHLRKINPNFDRSWVEEMWLFQDFYAQPVIPLHYSRLRPTPETPLRHLYLANMALVYPQDRGTNYAVEVGHLVARRIDPGVPAPPWKPKIAPF